MDHTKQRIDKARVAYAIQTLMDIAFRDARLAADDWSGACLRVAMRRHDVEHGVRPPEYELRDPTKLLQQFRDHPASKEYGYEATDEGTG